MKYLQIKLFLLLTIFVMSFTFQVKANRIQGFYFVNSQGSEANYKFEIGDKLEMSFVKNCNLYFGEIKNFSNHKINFKIEEQLWGDQINKSFIELDYVSSNSEPKISSEARLPWTYVEVVNGKKLFVSQCLDSNNQPRNLIVVSNQAFFSVIKEIIKHRVSLQQNPQAFPETTKLLGEQSDLIYTSYVVSYLWREKVKNKNVMNFLDQLLQDKNVPKFLQDFVRINLKKG